MQALQRKTETKLTMKAFVVRSYGSSESLALTELERPVPTQGEVLVRVRATSVNPYDWHTMRGEPRIARLLPGGLGLRRPNIEILGCDLAGQVEGVGPGVSEFAPGDRIFASVDGGGFGEYAAVPVDRAAPMPQN